MAAAAPSHCGERRMRVTLNKEVAMKRMLTLFALLGLAGAAPAADDSLAFQYTIEREQEGREIEATFLRGFETRDGLRLRVKLSQESYCYVIMSAPGGVYHLVFPDRGTLKSGGLPVNEWARIPKSTFLRMGEDPRVERMYIIVAAQRVPELDEAAARGQVVLSEAMAFEIRDRYRGKGTSSRDMDGHTVSIRYRPNPADAPSIAPSIVEEIVVQASLQAIDTAKRSDSK